MQLNTLETKFIKSSSVKIPSTFYNRISTGDDDIDLMFGTEQLKGIIPGCAITITGTPGAGKSSFLVKIAQKLITQGKRAAIASGEESIEKLAYTTQRLCAGDVDIAHIKTVEEIASAMHHYHFMVVDSFQSLRSTKNMKPKQFFQYAQDLLLSTAKETGCVLVFVLHITTNGLPKGGTDIIHAVDVNMKVTVDKNDKSIRIFDIYKNRDGETNTYMATMTPTGLDFKGLYASLTEEIEEKQPKVPANEKRKEEILAMDEPPHLTMDRIRSKFGISGQIAGNILREMVGEGKLQKFGRGANAVWKIAQECQKLHKELTK